MPSHPIEQEVLEMLVEMEGEEARKREEEQTQHAAEEKAKSQSVVMVQQSVGRWAEDVTEEEHQWFMQGMNAGLGLLHPTGDLTPTGPAHPGRPREPIPHSLLIRSL
jgi:hypothetical protein